MLLSILVYGYATGVFSSRKLEHATYDSVAFRFVAADEHPDHDTVNTFRKRFLKEITGLMVEFLLIARTLGVFQLGHIALDGSKLKANASKHNALSDGHIKKLDAQLQGEVKKLMALAEAADNEKIPEGLNLPAELARRADRLKAIATAKTTIETRAQERFERRRPTTRPSWISVRPNQNNAASRHAAEPRVPRSRARRTRIKSTSPTKHHAS